MKIVATATIHAGHVHVRRPGERIRARPTSRAPRGVSQPRKSPARRTGDGPAVVAGFSMTRAELAALDDNAKRLRVSRSEFVRRAVRLLAEQERPWSK